MKKSTITFLNGFSNLFGSAVLFFQIVIIFLGFYSLIIDSADFFLYILLFFIGGGIGLIILLPIARIVSKYCKKCKHPLYGCEYEYDEISTKFSGNANGGSYYTKVGISFTCPYCGKHSTVKRSYKLGSGNIQYKVDEYCKKRFRDTRHKYLANEAVVPTNGKTSCSSSAKVSSDAHSYNNSFSNEVIPTTSNQVLGGWKLVGLIAGINIAAYVILIIIFLCSSLIGPLGSSNIKTEVENALSNSKGEAVTEYEYYSAFKSNIFSYNDMVVYSRIEGLQDDITGYEVLYIDGDFNNAISKVFLMDSTGAEVEYTYRIDSSDNYYLYDSISGTYPNYYTSTHYDFTIGMIELIYDFKDFYYELTYSNSSKSYSIDVDGTNMSIKFYDGALSGYSLRNNDAVYDFAIEYKDITILADGRML